MKMKLSVVAWIVIGFAMVGCQARDHQTQASLEVSGFVAIANYQIYGGYDSVVSTGANTSQRYIDNYQMYFGENAGGQIQGRHNFLGLPTGAKLIEGQRSGNSISYHSVACTGDTFSGSIDLSTGKGSFSGTVCGVSYSNGKLSNLVETQI